MEENKRSKEEAREEIRDFARQIREERKQRHEERRQQRKEDHVKYPWAGLRRKIRSLRWKRNKMIRREDRKDFYQDSPWFIRIPKVYLAKPLLALMVIAFTVGIIGLAGYGIIMTMLPVYMDTNKNKPVDKEKIYAISPIDEEGAKRIDAIPSVSEKDTWTISVYIVGSNLEDMDENDLSDMVMAQVSEARGQRIAESRLGSSERLKNFSEELEKNNLEIPAYLYKPQKPVVSDEYEEQSSGEVVAEEPGAASVDIDEMTSSKWSDNISVVIQTGGATRWSNNRVNPNRTQRFLYHKGVFSEVDNLPLQEASNPETLTSFLNFCKEKYPADHNMLILWNHGGGVFGYGKDSIYGGMMSLSDIRKGLEGAYKPDMDHPAFDIIGFDACLMSSLEVTHALSGFSSYYAVSEEVEPGEGWNYGPWLEAMTKDATMSPARVAREIADSYMDFYMTQNVNVGWLYTQNVTFCVLDARKTEDLYQAWCDLAKQQLSDAMADGKVLAEIGRCSDKTTHFCSDQYNLYNTIDLGEYVDLMVDTYPDQCSRIKELIGESVLYHRENGSLSDSQGISVYLPGSVDSYMGLSLCLDYIYTICQDPAVKSLYYYKIAGCLNDEMQEYLATISKNKPWVFNVAPFREFTKSEPKINKHGFSIPIGEELGNLLQNYMLEAVVYDDETGIIINYGRDENIRLDGKGNMDCEFDGEWICYDKVPLATEVAASTASSVEYRSKILYNDKESYLCFTWDRDSEEFTVTGVRGVSTTGIFNEDPFNYLVNSRMNTEVKKGDTIVPIYDVSVMGDLDDSVSTEDYKYGKTIKVSKGSKIEMGKLPSGYYLTSAVISDQRGDEYYSRNVGNEVSGGKVKKRKIDTEFYRPAK